ncbi:hypothetical protein E2C01_056819 [Portunus trituberculatus]|uniref:Uncharacterized protein n=1 Tax=Portunus trituberculatus TaxID=210409 RepID=A0A5B7GYS4_PORTR|nr:hypothetical protein [Portunus trituberculatus]
MDDQTGIIHGHYPAICTSPSFTTTTTPSLRPSLPLSLPPSLRGAREGGCPVGQLLVPKTPDSSKD